MPELRQPGRGALYGAASLQLSLGGDRALYPRSGVWVSAAWQAGFLRAAAAAGDGEAEPSTRGSASTGFPGLNPKCPGSRDHISWTQIPMYKAMMSSVNLKGGQEPPRCVPSLGLLFCS
ncbi:hypothetical protein FKM82_021918 [Ascaphus truei]